MATIEELQQQVAALSAQVAAITAPPTDYYTSQYDGEEIDAAIGRALPGGGIDASLSNNAADHPHRNLLDNWDFRNPVNQRGASSYTMSGAYPIDRWRIFNADVSVNSGYIQIKPTAPFSEFRQFMETTTLRIGEVYTLSVYVTSVSGAITMTVYGQSVVELTVGLNTLTFTADASSMQGIYVAYFNGAYTGSEYVNISKVKLEKGTVSTLANDPPADYGAELAKCKRYFNLWASEAARTAALLEVGAMRTTPVLSTIDIGGVTYYTASADL